MVVYRGQDLDLRSPSEWSAAQQREAAGGIPADRSAGYGANGRGRQIWVDETVLACCNHAFDLAVAHRAGEVRLEHLLNAMTRVDAAALVLEARGVRVASLRRESAGIIANEIPVGFPAGRAVPKSSEALEDVLRLAAERAVPRRSPATIDDILNVLVDMKRDLPGINLLRTHSQSWNLRDTPEQRFDPPPAPRAFAPEPPRYAGEEPREWVRVPAGSAPYYAPEPPRPAPPPPMAPLPTMTDSVQNSRLDALERVIRDLSQGLNAERAAMSQLVSDLQRDTVSQRDDTSRFRGSLTDRIGSVERSMDAKFGELARTWSILGERLQSLEAAVSARTEPGSAAGLDTVDRRIADMERMVQTVADRIGGMERQLASRQTASVDLTPLNERLASLERLLAARPATPINVTAISDRLATIERMIATRPAATVDLSPINERLATFSEKIQSIEGWATEAAQGSTEATERLVRFERLVETGAGSTDRSIGQLAERLRALEEMAAAQRSQLASLTTSLGPEVKAMIGERFQALAAGVERQQSQVIAAVAAPLNDRIGMLDRSLAAWRQQTGEQAAGHQRDLKEVHEALVKLNANQQTIATSMDQWRLDVINDIGEVANQVTSLESTSRRPVELLETVTTNLQTLQQSQLRREEHRSRFKHWLMGTDDWYGASFGANGSKPAPRSPIDK